MTHEEFKKKVDALILKHAEVLMLCKMLKEEPCKCKSMMGPLCNRCQGLYDAEEELKKIERQV